MTKGRGILSPLRLPVPPLGQKIDKRVGAGGLLYRLPYPGFAMGDTPSFNAPALYGLMIFAEGVSLRASPTWQLVVWL